MNLLLVMVLVTLLGAVGAWPFRGCVASRRIRLDRFPLLLFSALFVLYWGIGTVLAAVRVDLLVIPEAAEYFPAAIGLAIVGLLAFQAGFALGGPRSRDKRGWEISSDKVDGSLRLGLIWLFVIFAVLRVYLIVSGYYFFGAVVVAWDELPRYFTSTVLLAKVGGAAVSTGMIVTVRRAWVGVWVAIYEVALLFMSTLKGEFLLWSVYYVALFVILRGVQFSRLALVLVVFCMLASVPAMQMLRSTLDLNYDSRDYLAFVGETLSRWAGDRSQIIKTPERIDLFRAEYPHKRLAAVELLATSQYMVNEWRVPYFYGETIWEGSRMLVPGFVWPDKPPIPKAEEALLVQSYGLPEEDRLGTVLSSAYSNFGPLGILTTLALYGFGVGALWRWSKRNVFVGTAALGLLPDLLTQEQMIVGLLVGARSFVGVLILLWLARMIAKVILAREGLKRTALILESFVKNGDRAMRGRVRN